MSYVKAWRVVILWSVSERQIEETRDQKPGPETGAQSQPKVSLAPFRLDLLKARLPSPGKTSEGKW